MPYFALDEGKPLFADDLRDCDIRTIGAFERGRREYHLALGFEDLSNVVSHCYNLMKILL